MSKKGLTYKDAGVDIEVAERALEMSKRAIDSTWQPHVLRGVGLFGGVIDLKEATRSMEKVTSTFFLSEKAEDSVIARAIRGEMEKLALVHVVYGAALRNIEKFSPRVGVGSVMGKHGRWLKMEDIRISFLDYIASSKLNPLVVSEVISKFAESCQIDHLPIIGGETAEMPGIFQEKGMAIVGASTIITSQEKVKEGKHIIVYSLKKIFDSYHSPVLVQSIDGVGTKTMLAKDYSSNVEDLVNHCINDIAVQGAKPLFMMVYADADVWRKGVKKQLRKGIEKVGTQANIKIIFSKPHPEVYQSNQIDLVGCVTGVVEKKEIIDGSKIEPGDRLIGLTSSGPHTNGYSLIRKIIKIKRLKLDQYIDELDCTLGEALRRPHRSYLNQIQGLIRECDVKGFAHITGGGLINNVSRILPDSCKAFIHEYVWQVPEIFRLIQKWGNVPDEDMWHTFNMGIGLVAVVSPEEQEKALKFLKNIGETAYFIGEVREREKKVIIA